jgi:hypothetical protein
MFTSWVSATIVDGGVAHVDDVISVTPKHDDSGVESLVYGKTCVQLPPLSPLLGTSWSPTGPLHHQPQIALPPVLASRPTYCPSTTGSSPPRRIPCASPNRPRRTTRRRSGLVQSPDAGGSDWGGLARAAVGEGDAARGCEKAGVRGAILGRVDTESGGRRRVRRKNTFVVKRDKHTSLVRG